MQNEIEASYAQPVSLCRKHQELGALPGHDDCEMRAELYALEWHAAEHSCRLIANNEAQT